MAGDSRRLVRNFLMLRREAGATFSEVCIGLKGQVSERMIAYELGRLKTDLEVRRDPPEGGRGIRGRWYWVPPAETAERKTERRYRGQLAGSLMKSLPAADADLESQAKHLAAILILYLRSRDRFHLKVLGSMLSLRDIQRAVERAGSRWQVVLFDTLQAATDPLLRVWDDMVRAALLMRPRVAWRAIEIVRDKMGDEKRAVFD